MPCIHFLHKHAVESSLEVEMNEAYNRCVCSADITEAPDYAVVN